MQLRIIIAVICIMTPPIFADYHIKLLTYPLTQSFIPFIAEQRIQAYREYPYLYEGNIKEESDYLAWFFQVKSCAFAVAYVDDTPVGFASGISFIDDDYHMKGSIQAFTDAGLDPQEYYYIADIIVAREHQGNKLGSQLLQSIEKHARLNNYTKICCITENHDSHPLKPVDYVSKVEALLSRFGYTQSAISISFEWLTRQIDGSYANQLHLLTYWIKNLN